MLDTKIVMLGTIYYCDGAESEMDIFFIALLSISDKLLNYKLEVLETFLPTFSKFEKKKKNLFFFLGSRVKCIRDYSVYYYYYYYY